MNTEERDNNFLDRWKEEKYSYQLWGDFVLKHIYKLIRQEVGDHLFSHFIRIPSTPRLKEDSSLLQKAFYRGKNYLSPYDDIEDKVGIRFVLLQDKDVRLVREIIESEADMWVAEKARDYEEEIEKKPYEFNYQSIHFVVRSKAGLQLEGEALEENLPCEIQIRTFLQHAYSEVMHDTLYKPQMQTTAKMKRAAAKSMALIEATGDYFDALSKLISEHLEPHREMNNFLISLYTDIVKKKPLAEGMPLNELLLERYIDDLKENDKPSLENWFEEHDYIGTLIAERYDKRISFRMPAILAVYYVVDNYPSSFKRDCPLQDEELGLICNDLGDSLYG